MQKELNPELFGGLGTNLITNQTGTGSSASGRFLESEKSAPAHVLMQSEKRVVELRNEVKQATQQMENLANQVNEFIKVASHKIDLLQKTTQKLEQNDIKIHSEAQAKISHLHTRLGERKSMELKVQEMIDRHNSVLRSYEMRIAHLQKILSEKDAQLLQSQSALNDAKMEIARLKRL